MGRRTSLATLAGEKVDHVPGASDPLLLTLSLDKLVPTRFNPRQDFGTPEQLREFGERLGVRQLQPATVVSRSGYLKLWPEEQERLGSASYVIANGERRYRGSVAAGLKTLDVVHHEGIAASRAVFIDSVMAENDDREDLDPIERAIGIETMVTEVGGADKVAEYYGKTKGWVSQQRKLLKLTPELQALVSSGDLPVRTARDIAGLPAAQQEAAWAQEQQRREEAKRTPRVRTKSEKRTVKEARAPQGQAEDEGGQGAPIPDQNAGRRPEPVEPEAAGDPDGAAPGRADGPEQGQEQTEATGGHGRAGGAPEGQPGLPVTPEEIVDSLAARLSPEDLKAVVVLLLDRVGEPSPG